MLRPAIFLVLAVALVGANAQQVESHGVPASVLSPNSPGTAHGVPSSVTSPAPRTLPNGRIAVNQRRVLFGTPHARRPRARREFVPVPFFTPAYPLTSDYVGSDQAAAQETPDDPRDASSETDALREAYNRGARDALAQQRDSRYGEHYLDSREKGQSAASKSEEPAADSPSEADNTPATVFIFKDGHKIQTQNYAIVGQTLIDFSDNAMKRIKLTDIDLDATRKANDDLGITVKFPPSTP